MAEWKEVTDVAKSEVPSMYNRWAERANKVSVMDKIHSIKVYNAAPGKEIDEALAGQLMIKIAWWDKYEKFDPSVWMNILKIRKWINWSYYLLDDGGNQILDSAGKPKRSFAFTEEYFRFSRNTDEIFFKNNNGWQVVKNTIWDLKTLFKTEMTPGGKKNPFYKLWLTQTNQPYASSFLSEWFIIYWVFTDGLFAWEYFRLFMSAAAFGNKWNAETKESTIVENSLCDALATCSSLFEEMKTTQGIEWRFDDSLLVATLVSTKHGNFFKPEFKDIKLASEDNTEQYDYIDDLCNQYKQDEFNKEEWDYAKLPISNNTAIESPKEETTTASPESDKKSPSEKTDTNWWISIEDIPF